MRIIMQKNGIKVKKANLLRRKSANYYTKELLIGTRKSGHYYAGFYANSRKEQEVIK